MSGWSVREAVMDDKAGIALVLAASGRRPWAAALRPAPDRLVLVAEQGPVVVGCARTDLLPEPDGAAPAGFYLGGLAVHPAERRRGVGLALILGRLEWLRRRTDTVHSIVNSGNSASLALHARVGFVEAARGARFGQVTVDRAGDELVLLVTHMFET